MHWLATGVQGYIEKNQFQLNTQITFHIPNQPRVYLIIYFLYLYPNISCLILDVWTYYGYGYGRSIHISRLLSLFKWRLLAIQI